MGTLDVKNLEVENPAMATVTRRPAEKDAVDAALEVWGRELPNLDLETEGIVERIDKLQRYVESAMQGTLEAHDLSHGEWKLMAHLRWGGPPYRGKPGKLAERLGLSSGAMTNRLDNLERRKLLRRVDDPDDRRAVFVELTDKGKRLWDKAVGAQAEKESLITTVLDDRERRQLNELLRRLVLAFEREHGSLKHKEPARAK